MADCTAHGTALDQAARALVGNTTNAAHARKQVESFLGHATMGGRMANAAAMPVARPESILLPSGGGEALQAMAAVPAVKQSSQQGPQINMQQPNRHTVATAAPQAAIAMPHYNMHQQHHQQYLAAAQQQQQMMMHNQMMMAQHAHQHQQHAQMMKAKAAQEQSAMQQQTQKAAQVDAVEDEINIGEEGTARGVTIEELSSAWAESLVEDDENPTTEGNVAGASMEELAKAWEEAQDEYYSGESETFLGGEGPASDLSSPEILENGPRATYRFQNDILADNTKQATTIPDNTNYMEEGMRRFENGDLKEAIRLFETELQANDPDNSTAWRMLGRCHAENDQDREAILCLENAVDRDPYCAKAMAALGVSYVNELRHKEALAILKDWITRNPKYAGLEVSKGVAVEDDLYGDGANGSNDTENSFQELQSLLLRALEHDASGTDSAEVWEALGVAANVTGDYETAVESFRKAIGLRPDDYQLWNKLGATLANSNRSAEALPAYHRAIERKPKYARAWLNLAISHSNLQNFDEAARCYLQTLSLNPGAVHCWSYLRVALSCSERWDLLPFAASQDLAAFQEHYDFILHNNTPS